MDGLPVQHRRHVGVGRPVARVHQREPRHRRTRRIVARHRERDLARRQGIAAAPPFRVRRRHQRVGTVGQPAARVVVAAIVVAEQRERPAVVGALDRARSLQPKPHAPHAGGKVQVRADAHVATDCGDVEGATVRQRTQVRVRRRAARVHQRETGERRSAGVAAPRHRERHRVRRHRGAAHPLTGVRTEAPARSVRRRRQPIRAVRQKAPPVVAPAVVAEQRERTAGAFEARDRTRALQLELHAVHSGGEREIRANVHVPVGLRDVHRVAVAERAHVRVRRPAARIHQRESGHPRGVRAAAPRHRERHRARRQRLAATVLLRIRRRRQRVRAVQQIVRFVVVRAPVAEQGERSGMALHPVHRPRPAEHEPHAADRTPDHHVGTHVDHAVGRRHVHRAAVRNPRQRQVRRRSARIDQREPGNRRRVPGESPGHGERHAPRAQFAPARGSVVVRRRGQRVGAVGQPTHPVVVARMVAEQGKHRSGLLHMRQRPRTRQFEAYAAHIGPPGRHVRADVDAAAGRRQIQGRPLGHRTQFRLGRDAARIDEGEPGQRLARNRVVLHREPHRQGIHPLAGPIPSGVWRSRQHVRSVGQPPHSIVAVTIVAEQ